MIIDSIKNIKQYAAINPLLSRGLELLSEIKPDTRPGIKKFPDGIKIIVSTYKTKREDDGIFESHRQFIDIQYLIEGQESIRWAPVSDLLIFKKYNRKKDITLYKSGRHNLCLKMKKGVFAIFLTADGHNPCLKLGRRPSKVKKAVIKVPVG